MRLIDAMSLRDGGTTSITVSRGVFQHISYTVDHSLPWDGRKRYVFRGRPFERAESHRLEIGCSDEVGVQRWLMAAVSRKFGSVLVQEFLAGSAKNPGKGKWFYALNFLNIMTKERGQPGAPSNRRPPSELPTSPEIPTSDSLRPPSAGGGG
jgi:hypothetical protein